MKDNYTKEDFKNAVIKNYGDKISVEEKNINDYKSIYCDWSNMG